MKTVLIIKSDLHEVSRSFRAMNTDVKTIICAPESQITEAEQALDKIQCVFSGVENRLSRFRPDSELSLLNNSAGKEFKASPLLFGVVAAALDSARLTDGIFDPTILPFLESAGYDRSFDILSTTKSTSQMDNNLHNHTWRKVIIDPLARTVSMPDGCRLDLGGIGKGWAVDRASRYLSKFPGYAINAGGDIRVRGVQAKGEPWTVGIADPLEKKINLLVIRLSGGAVCTSSITRRKWRSGSSWSHHIIDPRTGLPSDSGVISATVAAESASLAETVSKTALILGLHKGLRFIEKQDGRQGMLVMKDGSWITTPDFGT